jgi:hypothetical protein
MQDKINYTTPTFFTLTCFVAIYPFHHHLKGPLHILKYSLPARSSSFIFLDASWLHLLSRNKN